jgi:hypothetical protein
MPQEKGDLDHQIFHEAILSLQLSLAFEAARQVMGHLLGVVRPVQKGVFQEQGEAHQHFAPTHGPICGLNQIRHFG